MNIAKTLLILLLCSISLPTIAGVKIRYCIRNQNGNDVVFYTTSMAGQLLRSAGSYILANDGIHTYQESLPGNLTYLSQALADNILMLHAEKITDDLSGAAADGSLAGYQPTDDRASYYFKPFELNDFQLNQPDQLFVVACKLNPSNGAVADRIKCVRYTKDQMTTKLGNSSWYVQKSPYNTFMKPEVCNNIGPTNIYPA